MRPPREYARRVEALEARRSVDLDELAERLRPEVLAAIPVENCRHVLAILAGGAARMPAGERRVAAERRLAQLREDIRSMAARWGDGDERVWPWP